MALELHIWGPAFSLPSIDPHCLAAIAYLTQVVPRDQWALIASGDATVSPTKELPALRDGSAWIGGFVNIVDHLRTSSDKRWDLDHNLDRRGRANVAAFSAFAEAHGQPLVDLSLYVSSENYNSATRPAYSRILQWPRPWLITPHRRKLAKARTAHLNLSSLDVDNASVETENGTATKPGSDLIPPSLRTSRPTVTSLVRQPQHASRFRLNALSEAFFGPLQQLLGQKPFLLSDDNPSSLDCLALAYLALALLPEVPQPWLAKSMKSRYPELCRYVKDLVNHFFGGLIEVGDALLSLQPDGYTTVADSRDESRQGKETSLPWRKPEEKAMVSTGSSMIKIAFEAMPITGQLHKSNLLLESDIAKTAVGADGESTQAVAASPSNSILPAILAIGTIVTGVAGYLVYSGWLDQPIGITPSVEHKRLSDMGEAGAMLAMADFGGRNSKPDAEDARVGRVLV